MIGNGKMYVVVNKELGMSTGKTAAQVAHAVARLDVGVPKTMIVLEGTTEQIHNLDTYLERMSVPHHMYIDEGVNEVRPMSATALAYGMVADDFTPDFIKDFDLYTESESLGFGSGFVFGTFVTFMIGALCLKLFVL